jgi:uncharacterized DUF497 family protein
VEFEWDDRKSEACLAGRGFDFAYAVRVFLDPDRLVQVDDRRAYGEVRLQVLGRIERRLFMMVYTPRGDVIRIISARKASRREVERYEDETRQD